MRCLRQCASSVLRALSQRSYTPPIAPARPKLDQDQEPEGTGSDTHYRRGLLIVTACNGAVVATSAYKCPAMGQSSSLI